MPRTSQRLWIVSAGLLCLGAALMLVLGSADDGADRIGDRTFLASATVRCAQTEKAVVDPNRRSLTGDAEARRIDALATGWEAMVVDLRALPVDAKDAPKVDRWLRAWNEWTNHGRQYANALRAGDESGASKILRQSQTENATMSRFALVNGVGDCLFATG